jgi:toxin CcdB
MKQFDVFANPFPRSRQRQPFLVNLQTDLLVRTLSTIVIAPLEPAGAGAFADRLNPTIAFDGNEYVLVTQEIVAVRQQGLGQPVGSVADSHDAIMAALDMLFTGF